MLANLIRVWWTNVGATRSAPITKIIIAEAGNFPEITKFYHEEVISRGENITMQVLQRGIDTGEFRPVDIRMTTQLIIAPFLFLCMWKYSFAQYDLQPTDPAQVIEAHIDMTLRGLANPKNSEKNHE